MNAARMARNLVQDGWPPEQARSLSEHLADEIESTVATKDHVELVVSREAQQLRVEMHEEFSRFETRLTTRLDAFQQHISQRLDSQGRWVVTSLIVLFLAMLGNIIKDFLV